MNSIDLDDLARAYTYRKPSRTTRKRARDAAADQRGLLLDVGGGTGAHAGEWTTGTGVPVVVDPSAQMCSIAAARRGVEVVAGRAEALPFVERCAGLVYFHLSIHYGPLALVIDEACRVAEPGARIEIWTFAPETMASSALAQWFPSIGPIDAGRFPEIDRIVEHLSRHGASVEVRTIPEVVDRTAASWQEAVANRFVSTLQLISSDEIEEGLSRFIETYPNPNQIYRYTIDFVRIRATR
ncbi:MAG: class I SAM-dependent methyltransferase [Actinomycetia bacterium]|nr:class I SAM-dependent methyltransferase [Actinomycetes bacterium]